MVYWCLYTLRLNLGISEFVLIFQLWQMLSHIMLFLIILLTDVIVKVADFIATYLADVIAILCEMMLLLTSSIHHLVFNSIVKHFPQTWKKP